MGLIWAKKPIWANVGLEWDKCPDSAHMGPTYTCLLGYCLSGGVSETVSKADSGSS